MAATKFAIPEEFRSQLQLVEPRDTRSDDAILDSLEAHAPISSEKNVWAFWDGGVRDMPAWCQRSAVGWVRLLGPSWTVRVLNTVPDSPNYALKWISAEHLPRSFVDGTMGGKWAAQHQSDLCRTALLYLYGGVWIDVGCILLRHLDDVCWNQLEDPKSPYEVSLHLMYADVINNHFIASRKGNELIKRWHNLFLHIWKDKISSKGIGLNPLLTFLIDIDWDKVRDTSYFNMEYTTDEMAQVDYFGQNLSFLRICYLQDPNDGFNGPEYMATKVLVGDCRSESFSAEHFVKFAEGKTFDILATRLDADPQSPEYQLAYKTVWRMLTRASMQKVTRIRSISMVKQLGTLWDEAGDADAAPGTFAELLRYGAVHLEQTRVGLDAMKVPRPPMIIRKGLLEPPTMFEYLMAGIRLLVRILSKWFQRVFGRSA